MQSKIISELNSVGVNLSYYAHNEFTIATLSSQDKTAQAYLTSLMYQISTLQKRYEQIRLLDAFGNEVIRINKSPNSPPQITPTANLQNKANRYYFQESKILKQQQLYTSPFDLNIEAGKIERPLKPMIRFATPIHNKEDQLLGVAVINYNGSQIQALLEKLNIHQGDQILLLNENGYYLKANQPDTEWGFMIPERANFQFSQQYPQLWREMQNSKSGEITTEKGEYYFSRFELSPSHPFESINQNHVTLVMYVPSTIIHNDTGPLITGLLIAFVFLAPMLTFLGWVLASYQISQANLYKQLEHEARFDALTGLLNRKAISDRLQESINLNRRRKSPLSVGFIDVNDLKKMNDQQGHAAGDHLIQGAAKVITNVIRSTDLAGRLGGDEFLIVFIDCTEESANIIMNRIESEFNSLGMLTMGKPWSLSYGCTELTNDNENAADMIKRADNKMYEHKIRYKTKKRA
ncbi:sensor domain-containing diguanylate cyclase [Psychromonas sp. MME2]|uniref:sensor domain-containing diguanylate cyclase n=1 Tax=unclassified Psychromonas TaxID=2614957 RepID=UPI00339D1812